ncbi:MAG: flagellar motor switch protein FliM [Phycisphaerae bacterium]
MSEALDQQDIEALLSAVPADADSADGDADRPPEAPKMHSRERAARKDYSGYDFKRPERVSKEHTRALGTIHDGFARNFGATLSGLLRTIIDVRVVGVEQLTYSDFIHSLPNPTCFVIMQAPPLEGQMCLEISPLIVYPVVDRLLGGNKADLYIPQRALTSIEWRIISRIVDHALKNLSEVWYNLVPATFEVVERESSPQLVHIVAPSEVVVTITFEIKMGSAAGTMSMCIPFNTIEAVLGKLTTQSWFGFKSRAASDMQTRRIFRNLTRTTVNLTSYLGTAHLRLRDLRNLQVGDLIRVDKEEKQDLILQIEGRNKFAGRIGKYRGNRALRITRRAPIDEPL